MLFLDERQVVVWISVLRFADMVMSFNKTRDSKVVRYSVRSLESGDDSRGARSDIQAKRQRGGHVMLVPHGVAVRVRLLSCLCSSMLVCTGI